MTECGQTTPAAAELVRRMQNSEIFLRMTAIELRRIATEAPDIAAELQRIAQQLDTEAEELAGRDANDRASFDPGAAQNPITTPPGAK